MFSYLILCLLALSSCVDGSNEPQYTVLRFGSSAGDYIEFTPRNMASFRRALTVTGWIKRGTNPGSYPRVMYYYPGTVRIGSNGHWNYVNKNLDLTGMFPNVGIWFHYAMTWQAGGQQRVYINGEEIGNTTASTSELKTDGKIYLGGNYNHGSDYVFGGELHKFTMFAEELSAEQVKVVAEAGMCTAVEDSLTIEKLEWGCILSQPKTGNVVESTDLCFDWLKEKVEETSEKLNNKTVWLTDTQKKLNDTQARFTDTQKKLNVTSQRLVDAEKEIKEKDAQLEEARTLSKISKWDVLLTPAFYNKRLTKDSYNSHIQDWTMLEEFLGANVTTGFIDHFKDFHGNQD